MSTTLHLLSALLFSYYLLFPTASELCNPSDKKVLLAIKEAFNDPYVLISWKPDTDCCVEWNNVECDETTHRITSVTVVVGDLPGQIPAAIGNLPYLETLRLHKQANLTGPIPYAITKLKNLKYLDLTWNNLTGPVPSFLSKLQNLVYLHLSFNNLSGSIPSSLSTLRPLSSLRLDRNKLTGTIPASLSAIKGNGLYLILSHNGLTGEIPASFKDTDFGQVDVSRNKLKGDISMFFGPNKTTQIMDFSRNQFEFDMTKLEVYNELISLDLNHNKIYGSFPKAMTELQYLQIFNVSYNRLCGQIPVGGRLQSFDYTTYFHNRCLCGAPLNVTCS
ncbi:polygalacturonase inhibitor-like [Punica granatum]|uniref:Leucine-rich repeat-containing N-terminal plant-type domain-containing protein n=2 Tax=Punica granatum TaxID=22663 RepID=A0A218XEB5_PUNGR|nr:polygalacturonase inhibitor-like [Punica granatum]OWM82672.1 hypothetical protein CDL15_Pgr002247 [Punica granatum]PKI54203.1 hypothetical protein CRG98_025436 [Punica granatum]